MKSVTNKIILGIVFTCGPLLNAQTIQEGQLRTRNEQYDDAATIFNNIIAKKPTNGEAYFYAGINALEEGDTAKAIEYFDNGLLKAPKIPLSHVGKGLILMRQNKVAEAEAEFALAQVTKKKSLPAVYREISRAYLVSSPGISLAERKARAQKSLTYADKALAIKADYLAYLAKGDALLILNPGKANLALEQYKLAQAPEINPQPLDAFMKEAKTFFSLDDYSTAIDRTQLSIQTDPNFAPAYRVRADAFAQMGVKSSKKRQEYFDSAIYYYNKYLSLNNNPSARLKYIQALLVSENYKKTIEEGKNYLTKVKETPIIYGWIAYAYAGMKDEECDSVSALDGLANFDKYQERYLKPKNKDLTAQDKWVYATLLSRSKQLDAALPLWEGLLKDTAHTPKKYYFQAYNYYLNNWKMNKKSLEVSNTMAKMVGLKTSKQGIDSSYTDFNVLNNHALLENDYLKSNYYIGRMMAIDTAGKANYLFAIARNHLKRDPADTLYSMGLPAIENYLSLATKNVDDQRANIITMLSQKAGLVYQTPVKMLGKFGTDKTELGRYEKMKSLYEQILSYEQREEAKTKIEDRIKICENQIQYLKKNKNRKPAAATTKPATTTKP